MSDRFGPSLDPDPEVRSAVLARTSLGQRGQDLAVGHEEPAIWVLGPFPKSGAVLGELVGTGDTELHRLSGEG